jgi:hypothetical protein
MTTPAAPPATPVAPPGSPSDTLEASGDSRNTHWMT